MNPLQNKEVNKVGEKGVIRLCVLGASGVGKSSFCNFLCDKAEFKVGDGFDSMTQQPKTVEFSHIIKNETVNFEMYDSTSAHHYHIFILQI